MPARTNVITVTVTAGGCALARGCSANNWGYPQKRVGGRVLALHALVYEALRGPVPAGLVVRHTCDVPHCVSPHHLVVGTHADNVADRVARGRSARGEGHGRAKLDAEKVAAMRAVPETRASNTYFARLYGVDPAAVRRARRGETWTHLPMPAAGTAAVPEAPLPAA